MDHTAEATVQRVGNTAIGIAYATFGSALGVLTALVLMVAAGRWAWTGQGVTLSGFPSPRLAGPIGAMVALAVGLLIVAACSTWRYVRRRSVAVAVN